MPLSYALRARLARALVALVALAGCGPSGGAAGDGGRVVAGDGGATRPPEPGCANPERPGGVGGRCACTNDCAAGLRCLTQADFGYPGGRCSAACVSDGDCPAGARCRGTSCWRLCEASSECEEDDRCVQGACRPHCVDDRQCGAQRCNAWSGACSDDDAFLSLRDNFAACSRHEQCRSSFCAEGRCRSRCSVARQDCPGEGVCGVNIYQGTIADDGLCYAPCAALGARCEEADYHCGPTSFVAGAPLSCRP